MGFHRDDGFNELERLVLTRTNMLVLGSSPMLDAFLQAIRPSLDTPIHVVGPDVTFAPARTLVLTEASRLNAVDQAALRRWVSDPANVDAQILSLTSHPLYELVRERKFDSDLYYCLNTIFVELDG